ncbi:MAG: zinc ribbon domain-containing protein, partial [Armatimonadetes bacterium]|nr:zinc ribbon domain-containing protein [Armatimonadota bacterium]
MICPNCNSENREEARFCAHCGKQLTEEVETEEQSEIEREIAELQAQAQNLESEIATKAVENRKPEPLPEGALLFQRRYEIVAFAGSTEQLNEYEAVETEPRKRCKICRTLNAPESKFCEQCGSDLSDAELESLTVRLLE